MLLDFLKEMARDLQRTAGLDEATLGPQNRVTLWRQLLPLFRPWLRGRLVPEMEKRSGGRQVSQRNQSEATVLWACEGGRKRGRGRDALTNLSRRAQRAQVRADGVVRRRRRLRRCAARSRHRGRVLWEFGAACCSTQRVRPTL